MAPTEEKTVQRIRNAYTKGTTLKGIAESLDVSVSTVVRHTADLPGRRATKGRPRGGA